MASDKLQAAAERYRKAVDAANTSYQARMAAEDALNRAIEANNEAQRLAGEAQRDLIAASLGDGWIVPGTSIKPDRRPYDLSQGGKGLRP